MRHRLRWGALLVGAAAVAGLAAGCGGSSAAPPANAAGGNGFAAYTQCLARNGVVLPSLSANPRADRTGGVRPSARPSTRPSGGTGNGGGFGGFAGFGNQPPAGVDQATWDKAMQACASVRPSGGPGGGNGGANNSALVAYRNCLTEHGVTFPSGGPRGGAGAGGAGGGFAGLNTADPKVAAALTACAPLRPTGGPPRTTPAP